VKERKIEQRTERKLGGSYQEIKKEANPPNNLVSCFGKS
jgi:hypothetical protein